MHCLAIYVYINYYVNFGSMLQITNKATCEPRLMWQMVFLLGISCVSSLFSGSQPRLSDFISLTSESMAWRLRDFILLENKDYGGAFIGSIPDLQSKDGQRRVCLKTAKELNAERLQTVLWNTKTENPEKSLLTTKEFIDNEIEILKSLGDRIEGFLIEAFSEGDMIFYLMNWIPGDDLFEVIMNTQTKPSPTDLRSIFAQLTVIIARLHARRIAHRDVKPENIILDPNGIIHLIDFGCAIKIPLECAVSGVSGTMSFNPPEMFSWNIKYSFEVDYYSLGATLFFCAFRESLSPKKCPLKQVQAMAKKIPVDAETVSLLTGLLNNNTAKRVSCAESIMSHSFFDGIDWEAVSKTVQI